MTLHQDLAAVLPRLRDEDVYKFCTFHEKYAQHLHAVDTHLYSRLGAADRTRFVTWFLKRWAKIDLVNPVERGLYEAMIARVKSEERPEVRLGEASYRLRDFSSQGHDFQLLGYDWFLGVHDVQYDQYEQGAVKLAPGDVIVDAGAFIGDTAVFFHHKLAGRCQVHSFELLDENLALLVHNLERNNVPDGQVVINKLALTNRTGDTLVIGDGASQGSTSIFGKGTQGEQVETITLDDYVVAMNLERVDFIKMDIEGSEVMALEGARQTIRHFKPKLAICLYHKWDDVVTIPQLIDSMGVDYDYTFKWVQLSDGWEAVLLASPAAPAAERPARRPQADAADPMAEALTALTRAYIRKWGQADTLWREKQRAARANAAPADAA